MTRGRAPNLALPLTKALAQQRDYRARKAANIARLEQENEQLREENSQLAKELDDVRNGRGHGVDGQPRSSVSTTSSAPSSEVNARMLAEYQHLRANYDALEAEVRRKEHVLQALRDKEREAFVRLEGLLKQSFDVVGSGLGAQEGMVGALHRGPASIKEEPLQRISDPPLVSRSGSYGLGNQSALQRPSSLPNGHSAAPQDRRFLMDAPYTHRMQSSETTVHGETSLSPDSGSWRSRKRLRSSSITLDPPNHPQQPLAHQPSFNDIPLASRDLAYGQPISHPGPYRSAGPGDLGEYPNPIRRTSYTHLRPIATRHPDPNLHRYPLENGPSPTHSLPVFNSPRLEVPSGRRFTQPSLSTMTPPSSSRLRDNATYYSESVSVVQHPEAWDPATPLSSRDDSYRSVSRMEEMPPLHARIQEMPRFPGMHDNQARGYHAQPSPMEPPGILLDAPSRSSSAMSPGAGIRPSSTSRECGPASKCASKCAGASTGADPIAKGCERPSSAHSPRLQLPSVNELTAPPSTRGSHQVATQEAPPVSDCCNGLFDCTSLPASLWMPLHAMSTSYERGNGASQAVVGSNKVDAEPLDARARAERPLSAESSVQPTNDVAAELPSADTQGERVKPELGYSNQENEVKLSPKTADEECCFGILECDDA